MVFVSTLGILTVMAKKPLKILLVAAEASPYAHVGGIGRVSAHLSRALMKLGHDVRIMMPRYGKIDLVKYPLEMVYTHLAVPTDNEKTPLLICNVKAHQLPNAPLVYFLENMEYYEKRANEYGYSDDPLRWALLQRGTLEFLRRIQSSQDNGQWVSEKVGPWIPDVIHCNDWQTGLLPQYLATTYAADPLLSGIATIFTIHNMSFQGNFDHRFVSELDRDDGRSPIPGFFDKRLATVNAMRRGILFAQVVNTVSPTYAKEILTEDYGEGLDQLLREVRAKVFGIINGIDYDEFNPKTDKLLKANYDHQSAAKRAANKSFLQDRFNLEVTNDRPLFAISSRLDEQKGLALVTSTIDAILEETGAQLLVNGGGDQGYRTFFFNLASRFPKQVGVNLESDFQLPKQMFAGCDAILIPSQFEPCGIVQMEAMRYGCIPIVRKTGGLADTVKDYNPSSRSGYGFVFEQYNPTAFTIAVARALALWHHQDLWQKLVQKAMEQDFSWGASAKAYSELYTRAQETKQQVVVNE